MRSLMLLMLLLMGNLLYAQTGSVEGKVTDAKNGQPLTGVSVTVKGGTRGTSTDMDGRYTLKINPGKTVLVYSFSGNTIEIADIEVFSNKITTQDVAMELKAKTEDAVVVVAVSTAKKETAASLITFQKNTNTVASVISAEAIRRSPDRNTGEILKRIPGASLQDGRFIIVRGLADRYNQAMLNGVLLTSTEPDRKTFSFDLIPAQMIDNIVINKAFLPEYPGEWAGGLIQVNTKDIPSKNFLNVQIGTGYNTQSTFKKFYKDPQGGKSDWAGVDDGSRMLPELYTTKSSFDTASRAGKIAIGKLMRNSWMPKEFTSPLNASFQLSTGFAGKFFGKKAGGTAALSYSRNYKMQDLLNRRSYINEQTKLFQIDNSYNDDKYITETVVGALGNFALQFNSLNKISLKSMININNSNTVNLRNGYDRSRGGDTLMRGYEFSYKQNTFFSSQLTGEHTIVKPVKLKWYGSFNILDCYSPDQRRLLYARQNENDQFVAVLSNTLSQQSGSRIYQTLSDYIYTAGGDVTYNFKAFDLPQNLKTGYMFQVKDRLYDAQLFANYLPLDNLALRLLTPDKIFAPENFGTGYDKKFAFDAIKNRNFRYLANTILNAGFIQIDNQFTQKLRAVWGLRIENYDQLIGSVKAWDMRHTYSKVTDFLPGINITYKINNKTNVRVSGSETVVRPELRELSALNLYDFDLNASVQGKPTLKRTKVRSTDIRYELYPRAGEVFTIGAFYKHFKDPIEQYYNDGAGGASTFTFQNPQKAYTYGAELELRKKLDVLGSSMKNFTFQSNIAYIRSKISDSTLSLNRPLQGQSGYVINTGIMYDMPEKGINITTLFNLVGKRIYLVGDVSAGAPDVYEAPRALLDFQASKKILKEKGELKLTVSDILNRTQYFYQNIDPSSHTGLDKNVDAYRFTRKYGTTFNLTFNYNL